jgi:Mrp family chromosome partitioning ATPase
VEKLIDEAKARADFVVIDSAPLATVIDALPFAEAADEVLIVSRLGTTRLNKLDEVDDLLSRHGVNRTGIVLIGERPEQGLGYYYHRGNSHEAPAQSAELAPKRFGKAVR